MKKLMIAAAIVCAAVVSQAASCNWDWKTTYSGKVYKAGSDSATITGTAYIFALTEGAQQSVLDAFVNNTGWTTGSLDDKSVASGKISASNATDFQYGAEPGSTYSFFVALVDGDSIFISDSFSGNGDATSYTQLSLDAKTASQKAALESTTFAAGGWYTAVPEPTSGLLLLLGVAGLALKRRRA